MNVFIILSILVIIIGVLLIMGTPSVLFTLNWKEKNRKRKNPNVHVLQYFGLYNKYHFLDYQMTKEDVQLSDIFSHSDISTYEKFYY